MYKVVRSLAKIPEAQNAIPTHDDSTNEEAEYAQAISMPPIPIHNPPKSTFVSLKHGEPSYSASLGPSMKDLIEAI